MNIQNPKKIDIFDDYNNTNNKDICDTNIMFCNEGLIKIVYPDDSLPLNMLTNNKINTIDIDREDNEDNEDIEYIKDEYVDEDIRREIISCSDFFSYNNNELLFSEPIKRSRTISNNLTTEKSSYENMNEIQIFNLNEEQDVDDADFMDFILNETSGPPDIEKMYRETYECDESYEIKHSSNYNNHHFCFYCKNHMVIPEYEICTFLECHMISHQDNITNNTAFKKYSKYLLLVFRLRPSIFLSHNVMENKYIKNYILDFLGIKDKYTNKSEGRTLMDFEILNQYEAKNSNRGNFNSHIFEILFYQPKLDFIDYIKCDSCKNYLCPMHIYLANCVYKKCEICNEKKWTICGWCKPNFNEAIACKYIHKKIEN
jgi:hypothetical protein